MVAIQFKCTYYQYRKLTVWHRRLIYTTDTPGNEEARNVMIPKGFDMIAFTEPKAVPAIRV